MNVYFEQLRNDLMEKSMVEVQEIAMVDFGTWPDEMADVSKHHIVHPCVAVEQDACFS